MGRVIVTGSFDPMTLGHLDVIARARDMFSTLTVVMLKNPDRQYMFTEVEREAIAVKSLKNMTGVSFSKFDGMTADYCKQNGVSLIVRGIKDGSEYDYECKMADYNKKHSGAETILLPMRLEISATAVRERLKNKAPLDGLGTPEAAKFIEELKNG